MKNTLISPKLIALQDALVSDNSYALDQFWREIIQTGAPLIEVFDDDPGYVLVTFLWRAEKEISNVIALNALAGYNFTDIKARQMYRLHDTNLWYRSYRARNDVRTTYRFSPDDSLEPWGEKTSASEMAERVTNWVPDPFNPKSDHLVSTLELPTSPPQPWILPRSDIKTGQVEKHIFRSHILDNERQIWVYTPPDYTSKGEVYALLLLFDAEYMDQIPTPTILDNLIAERLIPPLVAVILDNPSGQTRQLELCAYPPFGESLVTELLPWLHQSYHLTADPKYTTVGGSSAGGLAAAFIGFEHSEVFGNVLSQSGAFWWKPQDEVEYEWLSGQFARQDRLPLRFYIDVGLLEYWYADPPPTLSANRHFRNVLIAKGYDVHYAEFNGGHDYICWRGTFSDGLVALMGKH